MEVILFLLRVLLIFIVIWSIRLVIQAIKHKQINTYVFLLPVFILFYILPEVSDSIFNLGFNDRYPLINEAMEDDVIKASYSLYCVFLLLSFNFHFHRINKKIKSKGGLYFKSKVIGDFILKFYQKYKLFLWIFILIPITFVFLIKGAEGVYSTYLNRDRSSTAVPSYHDSMSRMSLIGILISALIITALLLKDKLLGQNKKLFLLILFPVLIGLFWIHGKRSIVANYLLFQAVLLMISGLVSFKRFVLGTIIICTVFISFLSFYGKNIKDDPKETYYGLRADFSRDYGVKFVMHNDLKENRSILPYKPASFQFTLLFFVSRDIWPDKPWPYAVYFTNSAFGNFGQSNSYGWGLTTSIFSESISNMGFLGLFFAPFLLIFMSQKEAESKNPIFKLLSIIIIVLLILLQPIAYIILIIPYLIMLRRHKKNRSINKSLGYE